MKILFQYKDQLDSNLCFHYLMMLGLSTIQINYQIQLNTMEIGEIFIINNITTLKQIIVLKN